MVSDHPLRSHLRQQTPVTLKVLRLKRATCFKGNARPLTRRMVHSIKILLFHAGFLWEPDIYPVQASPKSFNYSRHKWEYSCVQTQTSSHP